ncbi:MAG: hypothetical protein CMH56_10905 [Myxococcales bacterium]|nr:hypothetical protein [Myxococcales bacterium]|tara:strand:+ start:280 stop:1791 length:1512 start_codon:yes stop_codon:yes gene_type:complete
MGPILNALNNNKEWLLWGTAFSFLTLLPLWVTPFLPLHDLPDHVGLAALVWDILQEGSLANQELALQTHPVPYLTLYVFIAILSPILGSLWAAKLFVLLCLMTLPWGVMVLLKSLGKDPRIGLLSFLLVWDFNLTWGFVAYHLGVGLVFWGLSLLHQLHRPRDLLKVVPLFLLAAHTHAQSYGILVLAVVIWTVVLVRNRKQLLLWLSAMILGGVPLIPWLWIRATSGTGKKTPDMWARFKGVSEKLSQLQEHTVAILPAKVAPHLPGLVLLFFCLAILILLVLPQVTEQKRHRAAWSLVGLGLFLYFAMPHALLWPMEQWLIYERHGTFLLVTLLFIVAPVSSHWVRGLLGCGLLLHGFWMATVTQAYADFGQRAAPFQEIIDATPRNQAIIMVTLDDNDPAIKRSPYNQFHAYVVAEKGGYDPFLFDNKSHPVVHQQRSKWKRPNWRRMHRFTMEKHGKYYDYIIVQGLKKDPLKRFKNRPGLSIHLEKEVGRWRLYRVER